MYPSLCTFLWVPTIVHALLFSVCSILSQALITSPGFCSPRVWDYKVMLSATAPLCSLPPPLPQNAVINWGSLCVRSTYCSSAGWREFICMRVFRPRGQHLEKKGEKYLSRLHIPASSRIPGGKKGAVSLFCTYVVHIKIPRVSTEGICAVSCNSQVFTRHRGVWFWRISSTSLLFMSSFMLNVVLMVKYITWI